MFALLPLILSIAPEIAKWIAGDKAGSIASSVTNLVQTVTGTQDPQAASAMLAADPAKAAELRIALARIAADAEQAERYDELETLKAGLADVTDARLQTVQLAQQHSAMAWGAPVVSVIIVTGFFAALVALLLNAVPTDPGKAAMLNILVGSLASGFAGVISYWLGSSAGSARKTELLASSMPAAPAKNASGADHAQLRHPV